MYSLSKKGFSIKPLKEKPVIPKKYAGKVSITEKIIIEFLDTGADYAEIKLEESKAKDVARALGRVIKDRYNDKVKYMGMNEKTNTVYLQKYSTAKPRGKQVGGTTVERIR